MMPSSQNQVTVRVGKTNSKSLEGYLDLRCGQVQLQLHLFRKFDFPGESGKFCFCLQKVKTKQNKTRLNQNYTKAWLLPRPLQINKMKCQQPGHFPALPVSLHHHYLPVNQTFIGYTISFLR